MLRHSPAAHRESRAFPWRHCADAEPESVPGAGSATKPARGSLFQDGQVRFGSADAEQLLLRRPGNRQVEGADQMMRGQLRRLMSRRDRLDDLRRQKGERQDPAEVAIADPFPDGEFGEATDLASGACRRLMSIPGVGQLTALAFIAAVDDPGRFRRSRDIERLSGLGAAPPPVRRDRLYRQHLQVR